jgi:phage shock protein PspC (stress-responsive transcriptional regulator)
MENKFRENKFRITRSDDGWIAGVCDGIAKATDMPLGLVRGLFVVFIFIGFVSPFLYLMAWIALPKESDPTLGQRSMLLGVCLNISRRVDLDVGVVRIISVLLALFGSIVTGLVYLILYFAWRDEMEV